MKIVYKPHLKIRLKDRKIPYGYPKKIVQKPERIYFDKQTTRLIAVRKLPFEGELRNIIAAYDIIEEIIEIVTIHIISENEIQNKIAKGRWTKHEKN